MKFSLKLTSLLVMAAALTFGGCGSSKKKSSMSGGSDTPAMEGNMPLELNGDSDSGKAGSLKSVYFGFNSSSLSSSARAALESNAAFLKNNSSVKIEVEGHCDERGGVQYNLALGENRARAVKKYLKAMGVSSSRVRTVSYGKERPVAFGHDEAAWSQNRRANFVITAK